MKITAFLIALVIFSFPAPLSRTELKRLSNMIAACHQKNGKITTGGLAWKKLRDHVIECPEMDTIARLKADTVLFMNGYRFMNRSYFGEVVAAGHHLSYDYSPVTKKYNIRPDRILSPTQVKLLLRWDTVEIRRKETAPGVFVNEDGNMNVFVFIKKGKKWTQRHTALANYYDPTEYKGQ